MKHHASLEMAKASSRRMVAEETYGVLRRLMMGLHGRMRGGLAARGMTFPQLLLGPMSHGRDRPAHVEFEGESHPLARRDQSPDGAPLLRHEGPMQARPVRLHERVGDDLGRIRDARAGVLAEGEAEGETGPHVAPDSG